MFHHLLIGVVFVDALVAKYVSNGWAVESRTETQAVLVRKKKLGWFWNILLTLVTAGLWLIVVFFKIVNRKTYRKTITVRSDGQIIES